MARPSLYETKWKDKLIVIQGWARDGLTDEQIADNMGVNKSTIYDWKKKYPEFTNALKESKDVADRHVECELYNKATGFTKIVKKPMKVKNIEYDDGRKISEKEEIIYVEEELYYPPDTTAQIFWLKNRKPNEWRDKKDVGVTFDKNLEDFFGSDEE